jgi:hypothetical protein
MGLNTDELPAEMDDRQGGSVPINLDKLEE